MEGTEGCSKEDAAEYEERLTKDVLVHCADGTTLITHGGYLEELVSVADHYFISYSVLQQ